MEPLLIGGIITAVVAGAGILFGRLKKVKVPQNGTWEKPPTVRYEVPTNEDDITRAVNWWGKIGHKVKIVEKSPPNTPLADGEIRIRIDPAEVDRRRPPVVEDGEIKGGGHGVTDTTIGKDGKIQHALILLYQNDALTLAHELGHALGFGHPSNTPTGHMMNPTKPGWDDHRGL
jgi:hypothetical protein